MMPLPTARRLNAARLCRSSTGEGDARVKAASAHALTCHAAMRAPARSLALALQLSHRAPQAAQARPIEPARPQLPAPLSPLRAPPPSDPVPAVSSPEASRTTAARLCGVVHQRQASE